MTVPRLLLLWRLRPNFVVVWMFHSQLVSPSRYSLPEVFCMTGFERCCPSSRLCLLPVRRGKCQFGWQTSLQRTSLQADTPPGGHASRRTPLQADTPPGRTLLQEDIPPVVKFFRCLQSDNPPAEGLQEDSSPAQRLQADRPPGGDSSSQKNIQVKAASYTDEIQFDHHNLNSSSHPVPILPLNSGFSSC